MLRLAVRETHRGRSGNDGFREDDQPILRDYLRYSYPARRTVTRHKPSQPIFRAAPSEKSSTLPRANGPRSNTGHSIRFPFSRLVTMKIVPNASVRCAQETSLGLKR